MAVTPHQDPQGSSSRVPCEPDAPWILRSVQDSSPGDVCCSGWFGASGHGRDVVMARGSKLEVLMVTAQGTLQSVCCQPAFCTPVDLKVLPLASKPDVDTQAPLDLLLMLSDSGMLCVLTFSPQLNRLILLQQIVICQPGQDVNQSGRLLAVAPGGQAVAVASCRDTLTIFSIASAGQQLQQQVSAFLHSVAQGSSHPSDQLLTSGSQVCVLNTDSTLYSSAGSSFQLASSTLQLKGRLSMATSSEPTAAGSNNLDQADMEQGESNLGQAGSMETPSATTAGGSGTTSEDSATDPWNDIITTALRKHPETEEGQEGEGFMIWDLTFLDVPSVTSSGIAGPSHMTYPAPGDAPHPIAPYLLTLTHRHGATCSHLTLLEWLPESKTLRHVARLTLPHTSPMGLPVKLKAVPDGVPGVVVIGTASALLLDCTQMLSADKAVGDEAAGGAADNPDALLALRTLGPYPEMMSMALATYLTQSAVTPAPPPVPQPAEQSQPDHGPTPSHNEMLLPQRVRTSTASILLAKSQAEEAARMPATATRSLAHMAMCASWVDLGQAEGPSRVHTLLVCTTTGGQFVLQVLSPRPGSSITEALPYQGLELIKHRSMLPQTNLSFRCLPATCPTTSLRPVKPIGQVVSVPGSMVVLREGAGDTLLAKVTVKDQVQGLVQLAWLPAVSFKTCITPAAQWAAVYCSSELQKQLQLSEAESSGAAVAGLSQVHHVTVEGLCMVPEVVGFFPGLAVAEPTATTPAQIFAPVHSVVGGATLPGCTAGSVPGKLHSKVMVAQSSVPTQTLTTWKAGVFPAVTGMWGVPGSLSDPLDAVLVISFLSATRVLQAGEEMHDITDVLGVSSCESTVATGLVADGLIVQVTSSAVQLLSLEGILPDAPHLAESPEPGRTSPAPPPCQQQQSELVKAVTQVNTTVASILGSIDLGLQAGTPCSSRIARINTRGSLLAKVSRTGPGTCDTWAGQAVGGDAWAGQASAIDTWPGQAATTADVWAGQAAVQGQQEDRAGSFGRSRSWSGLDSSAGGSAPGHAQHVRNASEKDPSMTAGLLPAAGGPQSSEQVQDMPVAERDLSIQSALRHLAVASSTEEGGDDVTTGQSAEMECDSRVTGSQAEAEPRVTSQDHVDPPCVWRPEMCEGNTAGHVLTAAVAPGLVALYQAGSHVVQVLRVTCVSTSQASPGVGPGWQGQVRKRRRPASQLAVAVRIPWQHEVSCMQLELVEAPHTGLKGQARLPTPTSQQYFLLIGHHQPATSLLHLTVTSNAVHVVVLSQAVPPAFKTNYQLNESVEPERSYIPHSILMQQSVTQHVDAPGQDGVQCDTGPSAQVSDTGNKAVSASETARKAAAVQVVVKWLVGFRQGTLGLYKWAGSTYPQPVGSTELLWVVQLGSTPLSLTSLLQNPYPSQSQSVQHSHQAASKQVHQLQGSSSTDITWSHVAVVGEATWMVHVVGPSNRILWADVHVYEGPMALLAPVRLSDEVLGDNQRFPIVMSVNEDTSWRLMSIGIAKPGTTSNCTTRKEDAAMSTRHVGHTSSWWSHVQPVRVTVHGTVVGVSSVDDDTLPQAPEMEAQVMQVLVHTETRTLMQLCRASFDGSATDSGLPIRHQFIKINDKQAGNTLGMYAFPRTEDPTALTLWSKVGPGDPSKVVAEDDQEPQLGLIAHSATLVVPVLPKVPYMQHFMVAGVTVSDPAQPHVVGAIKLVRFHRLKVLTKALDYSSRPVVEGAESPGAMGDPAGLAAVCNEEAVLKLPARVGALCVLPSGCLIAAVGNRLLCVQLTTDNQLVSSGSICARSHITMLACCSEPNVFAASDGTSGVTLYVCNPTAQRPEPAIQVIASDILPRPVTSLSLVEDAHLVCQDSDVALPSLPSGHRPTPPAVPTPPEAAAVRHDTPAPAQDDHHMGSPAHAAGDQNMTAAGTLDANRVMLNPAVTVVVTDNVGVVTLLRPQPASLSPVRNLSQVGMLNLYDVGVMTCQNPTGTSLASQTQPSNHAQGVGGAVGLLTSIKGAVSNGHFIHHTPLHEPKALLSKGSPTLDPVTLKLACSSGALYELRHVVSNRAAMLLGILEGLMPTAHPALAPLSGCNHAAYRGTYTLDEMQHHTAPNTRNVVDGDLLEQFLDLPWAIRRHVVHRLLTTSKVACSLLQGLLPLVGAAAVASSSAGNPASGQEAGEQAVAGVEDAARLDAAVLFITSLVQQVLYGA